MQVVRRAWLPLVIVAVVLIAGFTVDRIRGFFASEPPLETPVNFADDPEPFEPKVVEYEIDGLGGVANINYMDLEGKPQRVDGAALPWHVRLETTNPSAMAHVVAQGDGSSLTCRIIVDGELKEERTVDGVSAQTFCIEKSA
ncbi:MmpS family transport accessory protein [Mycolicibacterium tokaiense]|uniref:Membrane protein n=1 Tax=Mycolicibacterium tokaiense TaxID=39695 RepID=A0A378TGU5_9MYCO|nr:MmpS family transport accessory protein [Mycolicibacterium tokaiense]BBY85627.1 siderophore export accessory protein MmpS5 [Mycolicibacterium tokaiense]STZ59860.1 membrane protein [Mycolicibacterium tokaiense]